MTSQNSSEATGTCPDCGAPFVERPLYRYPVAVNLLFGASFIAFILLFDRVRSNAVFLWSWCALQIALGAALVHLRMRAKKRVFRCVRCTPRLR
ncbi:MAG: hypothetical protein A2583_12780 [Bdellovibrionales bacterium RIFOXYD1_FULL_53_11]|nr:MAG: hypothetical protein A2583_12780 [Bdellovibrionales bacterium RIFOXYD1_FULL_53_11]